jgi:hypothetical protein
MAEIEQTLTLTERGAHMTLPLDERRKRLAAQAERMVEHYEPTPERIEREAWQGGDR